MKEDEIEKIIDFLTEKLYSHQYFIGRKEAKEDLGIKTVVNADAELAGLMTEMYEEYAKEMRTREVWNPEMELGENQMMHRSLFRIAFVESANISSYFEIDMEFRKVQQTVQQQTPQGVMNIPQEQVVWRAVGQGWKGNM